MKKYQNRKNIPGHSSLFGRIINNKKIIIEIFVLLSLFIISFFLFLYPIRLYKFWDEAAYLTSSDYFVRGDAAFHELFIRAPLLPIIIHLIKFIIPGDPLINLSYFFALFCGIALFPLYMTARKIAGPAAGFFTAFYYVTNILVQHLSHQVMTDLPAAVFLAYMLYFFTRVNENKKFAYYSGIFLALALLMRLGILPAVPIIFFIGIIILKDYRDIIRIFTTFLIVISPYFIWLYWKYNNIFYSIINARQNITGSEFVPGSFYLNEIVSSIGPMPAVFFIIFLVYYISLIIKGVKKSKFNDPDKNKMVTALILWIITYTVYLLNINWKEPRFLMPVYLSIFILAGAGTSMALQYIYSLSVFLKRKIFQQGIKIIIFILIIFCYSTWNFSYSNNWMNEYYNYISRLKILIQKKHIDQNRIFIDKKSFNNSCVRIAKYLRTYMVKNPDRYLYLNEYAPVIAYYSQPRLFCTLQYSIWTNIENKLSEYMPYQGVIYIRTNTDFHPSYDFAGTNNNFKFMTNIEEFGIFSYDP